MHNPSDDLKRLQNHEVIQCHSCSEGKYVPIGEVKLEHCLYFKCDKCGEPYHFFSADKDRAFFDLCKKMKK